MNVHCTGYCVYYYYYYYYYYTCIYNVRTFSSGTESEALNVTVGLIVVPESRCMY